MFVPSSRKTLEFYGTIVVNGVTIDRVRCRFVPPRKLSERVQLVLQPDNEQHNQMFDQMPWNYSIESTLRDRNGAATGEVYSPTVIPPRTMSVDWPGSEINEAVIIGHPAGLSVSNFSRAEPPEEIAVLRGDFWITPNEILTPSAGVMPDFNGTGNITAHESANIELHLSDEISIRFENRYRYYTNDLGERVTFTELVAAFRAENCSLNEGSIEAERLKLEDVLLLGSFAGRRACVCAGWEARTGERELVYYVGDRTMPEYDENTASLHPLVERHTIGEFLTVGYPKLKTAHCPDSVRRALRFASPLSPLHLEARIVDLFTGIEMLVSCVRKAENLDVIFGGTENERATWRELHFRISKLIDTCDLEIDKNRREMIKSKLQELNRVSFPRAFKKYCSQYDVLLDDLWPLTSRRKGIPLSDVRNYLVHGEVADRRYSRGFAFAQLHLQWTLERMIFGFLGWDIEKTMINPFQISNWNAIKHWREAQSEMEEWAAGLKQ